MEIYQQVYVGSYCNMVEFIFLSYYFRLCISEKGKCRTDCLYEKQLSACKIIQCLKELHAWSGPQDPMMQMTTHTHTKISI